MSHVYSVGEGAHSSDARSLYQSRDEQRVCGAVVGLPVPPQFLQAQRLPVQGLPTFLARRQGIVAVPYAPVVLPLEGDV